MPRKQGFNENQRSYKKWRAAMKLSDHLAIIENPVVLEVLDGEKVLYKGYKGCIEFQKDKEEYLDREVEHFALRVDARGRNDPQNTKRTVITELNCGVFNYCDLYIELVYSYKLANK